MEKEEMVDGGHLYYSRRSIEKLYLRLLACFSGFRPQLVPDEVGTPMAEFAKIEITMLPSEGF
jgi:hypothetical protein